MVNLNSFHLERERTRCYPFFGIHQLPDDDIKSELCGYE
jgi:hypothetical protein